MIVHHLRHCRSHTSRHRPFLIDEGTILVIRTILIPTCRNQRRYGSASRASPVGLRNLVGSTGLYFCRIAIEQEAQSIRHILKRNASLIGIAEDGGVCVVATDNNKTFVGTDVEHKIVTHRCCVLRLYGY